MLFAYIASALIALMFFLACAFVWTRGGEPEKLGAAILLTVVGLSAARSIARIIVGAEGTGFDLAGLTVDTIGFLGFAWLALFAWRIWPLWASSIQLVAIMAHIAPALDVAIKPTAYEIMRNAPTYLLMLLLAIATANYRIRGRMRASQPSWRSWSERLNRIAPMKLLRRF
jgi:hypothetical protein